MRGHKIEKRIIRKPSSSKCRPPSNIEEFENALQRISATKVNDREILNTTITNLIQEAGKMHCKKKETTPKN